MKERWASDTEIDTKGDEEKGGRRVNRNNAAKKRGRGKTTDYKES